MTELLKDSLSKSELVSLSSIVQVGDAAYKELMENQRPMFGHPYFADTRGRIRTKLVQIQCEIESHDSGFPFDFSQMKFSYKHIVPQLQTKNIILHIARSTSPNRLPYQSRYKVELSHNNKPLCRQHSMDFTLTPPLSLDPFYGILVFGGIEQTFSAIQFPEPGYHGIAESIIIPQLVMVAESEAAESFERKKAILKKEFLAHEMGAAII